MKKHPMLATLVFLSFLLGSTLSLAEVLTQDAIEGKWLFTHITMEGGREIKVNQTVDFGGDGTAVYYGAGGNETSRGTYSVEPAAINYSDKKGNQVWKLVSLENGKLHVDHRGAGMFFEKK